MCEKCATQYECSVVGLRSVYNTYAFCVHDTCFIFVCEECVSQYECSVFGLRRSEYNTYAFCAYEECVYQNGWSGYCFNGLHQNYLQFMCHECASQYRWSVHSL